jgi:hypothetical protein
MMMMVVITTAYLQMQAIKHSVLVPVGFDHIIISRAAQKTFPCT